MIRYCFRHLAEYPRGPGLSVYPDLGGTTHFFSKFFAEIPNLTRYHTIIGGDFKLVKDVTLDRSSTRPQTLSKSATTLKFHTETLGLSDPGRTIYPSNKAFSFFFKCASYLHMN